LRGINTYNLFKRVVWSGVTHRPNGDRLDQTSEVNLPLLKGLLNEIYSEIYVTDIHQRAHGDFSDYKKIDIHSYEGYNNYAPLTDHESIHKQVS